ncbi:LacI family DNA-binding transcriptional regulator [Tichowtungia aerotolerans]|uniref:Substrate-binding domain-containing protein n=1 Tax=Tichowtungia aerotolerans TaxID=2697043 RepID=A0A6P1M8E6_9BACT|nr:LacI family DNA-binding transcriptional regulator [Tichowtungia aerotolerans]QHI70151.1 substrate-binding domain-containing protein [Tichowtungia aerotolerans]
MKKQVTIKDIAKELGVSHSVVSRALNPNPDKNARISPETKERIVKTAKRLGFQRNRIAEFLKHGKAATIGVFMPEFSNRLGADLMMGISEAAAEYGFPLNFYFGMNYSSFETFIHKNIKNPCSGIISYPFEFGESEELKKLFSEFADSGGKTILLNTTCGSGFPVLYMNNQKGSQIAADFLIKKACSLYLVDNSHRGRSDSFLSYIDGKGFLDRCVRFDFQEFPTIFKRVADNRTGFPIGIFAANDQNAADIIRKVRELGLQFKEEIALVGYDDLQLAAQLDPPLTTIHQPFRYEGRRAVEKLINVIYGGNEEDESIDPFLVERETA